MSSTKILGNIFQIRRFASTKRSFSASNIIFDKPKISSSPAIPKVKGLSDNVVKIPNEPVGPGASKSTNYQNPEYFCYDKDSYFEAEVELLKYRCPQPSIFKYYEHTNPK